MHTDLLTRYLARQRVRDALEADKARLRGEIATLAARRPKPAEELRERHLLIASLEKAARVQVSLAAHTRAIADGLAWKALRYDRAAITVLGQGRRVDGLADDGVGLQAELAALAGLSELDGAFTIHNDLATILRHGDLTPELRRAEIREVKATAKPGPNAGQALRLSAATRLINDGVAVEPDTSRAERLHRLSLATRTSLGDLREVLEESRAEGYAHRALGPMQHVTVIDYRAWAGRESELAAHDADVRRELSWGPEQKTFEWLASLRRMRDRRASFGGLAPLPIFPLDAEDIADVMLGRLEVRAMLRGGELERAFAANGIRAEVEFGSARDDVFLRIERGRVSLVVPPVLRERMLFELLTPDTVIQTVAATLDILDAQPDENLLPAADESGVWA